MKLQEKLKTLHTLVTELEDSLELNDSPEINIEEMRKKYISDKIEKYIFDLSIYESFFDKNILHFRIDSMFIFGVDLVNRKILVSKKCFIQFVLNKFDNININMFLLDIDDIIVNIMSKITKGFNFEIKIYENESN